MRVCGSGYGKVGGRGGIVSETITFVSPRQDPIQREGSTEHREG
jgi:hypothetical protein